MFGVRLILTLLNIKGLGRKTINEIIKYKVPENLEPESILNLLHSLRNEIKRIPKVSMEDIIKAKNKCENIIFKCKKEKIEIISILDEKFPTKLKIIDDNPILIYHKGNIDCIKNNKSVALVGTRIPTQYGMKISHEIGKILAQKNFVVISGLALGCDTFAHKGSIKAKGKTIAVMPCGLNTIYPKTNEKLYEEILENDGCIISEYEPDQKIYKNQFVDRDRLESALAMGIIVVEATLNSGTMHTVNFALNQNKIVGCYKPEEKYSKENSVKGNLNLLKNERIYAIDNMKSLDEFIKMLNEKIEYINEDIIKENIQITFIM